MKKTIKEFCTVGSVGLSGTVFKHHDKTIPHEHHHHDNDHWRHVHQIAKGNRPTDRKGRKGRKVQEEQINLDKEDSNMNINEAKKDEPEAPDPKKVATRKKLQDILDAKRERAEKGEDEPKVKKHAGKAYGGSAQKEEPEEDEGEKKMEPAKRGRGRPRKSFSEMIDLYNENGLKALNEMVIAEEPDNDQYHAEVEKQKRKASGTATQKDKAEVAKPHVTAVKQEEVEQVDEVAAPGFEGTVKAMKKHKKIDNPWALSWWMKKKGYKSHKKE